MRTQIYLILLLTILFIFCLPIFSPGFYKTHDGEAHLSRFAAYFKAFSEGQIPPRWAADLNYRYGSPVFIFYYPLPGYIASLIHYTGMTFEHIFKLLIAGAFIGSGITFYLWMRVRFNPLPSFMGSLLYGLAPYHFLDMYIRGDVAELIALFFVPLVFFCLDKFELTKNRRYLILGSIYYGLLILSHNGISLLFSPVFLVYILLRFNNKKVFFWMLWLLILGLLLSAYFWLPALIESKFMTTGRFIGDMYKNHFPGLLSLIYSSWGTGPDINKPGGLSAQLGFSAWLIVLAGIYKMIREKRRNKYWYFWISVFLFSVFLSLPVSAVFWHNLPLMRLLQFPWRLTAVSSFAAAALAGFIFRKLVLVKYDYILIFLIILSSSQFIKLIPVNPRPDNYYLEYTGNTSYHGEETTIWTAGDPAMIPEKNAQLFEGVGNLRELRRSAILHEYQIQSQKEVKVVDYTHYFPGWQVYIDTKKTAIEFQDPRFRGLITFISPGGIHKVAVRFYESPIRFFADILTLAGIVLITLEWCAGKKMQKLFAKT